jgi:hypothetical protein
MMDDVRCVEGIIQAFSGWTEEKHSATWDSEYAGELLNNCIGLHGLLQE